MRTSLVLFALALAGCSSVYPADDFSYAECGPALQHWDSRNKPCTTEILDCLTACADSVDCQQACYDGRPVCATCLFTESVLCGRESGCEREYEDLTCCAQSKSCTLGDDTCLNARCGPEMESSIACQGEVSDACVSTIIEACVR